MLGKGPGTYAGSSVWASVGRYYVDGRPVPLPNKLYEDADTVQPAADVRKYRDSISYEGFKYLPEWTSGTFAQDGCE